MDVNEYARERASAVSPPNFVDWRAGNRTLTALGAYNDQVLTLTGGPEPTRVSAGVLDPEVLPILGVAPLLGRAFTAEDVRAGARKVTILGYDIWQRAYGGDRGLLSQTVTLEGEPHEVVGVMPPGFDFPRRQRAVGAARARPPRSRRQPARRALPGGGRPASPRRVGGAGDRGSRSHRTGHRGAVP